MVNKIMALLIHTLVHYITPRFLRFPEGFFAICSSYFISGIGAGNRHIMTGLYNCILICYDAYFNYPVLVLVCNIIWF